MTTEREAFWNGFWSVFRHPVTVYCFGFVAGFVVRAILEMLKATK